MAIFGNMIGGGGKGDTADVSAGFLYGGKNTTYIYSSQFMNDTKIHEVNYPEVTRVYRDAFAGCTNLFSASFPKLDYIANGAFSGCVNLEELDVTNVTTLGPNVFTGCSKLSVFNFTALTKLSYSNQFTDMGSTPIRQIYFPNVVSVAQARILPVGAYTLGSSSSTNASKVTRAFLHFDKLTSIKAKVTQSTASGSSSYYQVAAPFDTWNSDPWFNSVALSEQTTWRSWGGAASTIYAYPKYGAKIAYDFPVLRTISELTFRSNNIFSFTAPQLEGVASGAFAGAYIEYLSIPNATFISRMAFAGVRFGSLVTEDTFSNVTYLEANAFTNASFPYSIDGVYNDMTLNLSRVSKIGNGSFPDQAFYSLYLQYGGIDLRGLVSASAVLSGAAVKSVYFSKLTTLYSLYNFSISWLTTIDMRYVSVVPSFPAWSTGWNRISYQFYESAVTSGSLSIIVPSSLYTAFKTASYWSLVSSRIFSVSV